MKSIKLPAGATLPKPFWPPSDHLVTVGAGGAAQGAPAEPAARTRLPRLRWARVASVAVVLLVGALCLSSAFAQAPDSGPWASAGASGMPPDLRSDAESIKLVNTMFWGSIREYVWERIKGILLPASCVLLTLLTLAGLCCIFAKAGDPGWAVFIPIYNLVVALRIAGKPTWWIIPSLLGALALSTDPIVRFSLGLQPYLFVKTVGAIQLLAINLSVMVSIARKFGRSVEFGVGMVFLPFLLVPILGFGGAQYQR